MSENGSIHIFSGDGKGKTSAAIGQGIKAASQGRSVVVIQFLKGKSSGEFEILRRLEPDIKLFSFEKSAAVFDDLTPQQRNDELQNIKNGLNFAHKVLATNGCDVLILDEFLGLIDTGIISIDDLRELIDARSDNTDIILTGINISDEVTRLADEITNLTTTYFTNK